MRAVTLANLVAAAALLVLALVAVVLTVRLGFMALMLLGAGTWLVCARAELNEDSPTWSAEVFRARMARPASPETRAAAAAARAESGSVLALYRRCGMLLAAVGAAGFAWELWR